MFTKVRYVDLIAFVTSKLTRDGCQWIALISIKPPKLF